MKDILFKYLDNQRLKYEKLYCKHHWIRMETWSIKTPLGANQENVVNLYSCKKCGKFKKVDITD